MAGGTIDVTKVEQALAHIERDELADAAKLLAPLVKSKRFTKPRRINAEPLEVDEVRRWLRSAIDDPAAEDAPFYIERAYYKLRAQRPAN